VTHIRSQHRILSGIAFKNPSESEKRIFQKKEDWRFHHFSQGGNGGFLGFRIPENPRKIPGIQWESREYIGNPGNTMGIPGIQWESREYNGNPGNTMGIPGIQWKSREYDGNSRGILATYIDYSKDINLCITTNEGGSPTVQPLLS
jgi:hypothetical protein